jgi:hypothetical protein
MSDTWIQTFSGVKVFPLHPRIEDIKIEDIAHALSLQCRFADHVREFYSVADHCLHVAAIVPHQDALWGLLHDASEAYLVDFPRPVKRHLLGKAYREAEARLMAAICERFGLPVDQPDSVTEADHRILITEQRDLLGPSPDKWTEEQGVAVEPYTFHIVPMDPKTAWLHFLDRFRGLARD